MCAAFALADTTSATIETRQTNAAVSSLASTHIFAMGAVDGEARQMPGICRANDSAATGKEQTNLNPWNWSYDNSASFVRSSYR